MPAGRPNKSGRIMSALEEELKLFGGWSSVSDFGMIPCTPPLRRSDGSWLSESIGQSILQIQDPKKVTTTLDTIPRDTMMDVLNHPE